jgi:hypothetical protein
MAKDYGVKVSKPGYDALTATDENLSLSSSFPILKATLYGLITTTGGVVYQITHSLGYRPSFLVYAKGSTYRFKLPRFYLGSDPVGGGVTGYVYADTTKLYIMTSPGCDVYYYIFADSIDA